MNDAHDNEQTDKEMSSKLPWPVTEEQVLRHAREGGVVKRPNPIHTDRNVQHIDIRLYFNLDANREATLDDISRMLQDSPLLCDMISAYELKNDGFSHLLPDDKPLA